MPFRKPHQTSDTKYVTKKPDGQEKGWNIEPKGLNIVWGNDHRYWKTQGDYAELIQVSWLEVSGKVPVEREKTYSVKFEVVVKKENGFGWDNTPVLVMAKIGKAGSYKYKEVKLVSDGLPKKIPEDNGDPEKMVIITVGKEEKDLELHFGLYEVWSGKWKGGLIIKKAEVTEIKNPKS